MCGGVTLPALGTLRRTASSTDLTRALESLEVTVSGGLKPSKSAVDLSRVVELLQEGALASELSTRLATDQRSACGLVRSSGDDTARGSPTSGYEQLLRSRSPSAVLFSSQDGSEAAGHKPTVPPASAPCDAPPAAAPAIAELLSQRPAARWEQSSMLPGDHPFLESAAAFSVVQVPPSGLASTLPATQPLHDALLTDASAATPGAGTLRMQPPAGEHAAEPCPKPAPLSALAPPQAPAAPLPPSSRFAVQQQPSLISHSPPLASASSGSSSSGSPSSSSAGARLSRHSRSGSLSAEIREASLSGDARQPRAPAAVDCTLGHSAHLSEGHAAEELFYRLNHARQTVDFVKRQAQAFSALDKAALGVWEALELLNGLREYEAALLGGPDATPDMPLLEHALQSAEACRAAFPDEDYMHLAGLLAPLGKLLAHSKFGAEPQFAICGETFPVGCRFHPAVAYSQFFSANPDRRKRLYNSPTGVYRQGCGLGSVLMSWGGGEYLHMVLRLNGVALPPEALFCIRHQKLRCVFRPGGPYSELLSEFDRVQLPRLAKFQQLCKYRRMPRAEPLLVPAPHDSAAAAAAGEAPPMQVAPQLRAYYDRLLAKYVPQGALMW